MAIFNLCTRKYLAESNSVSQSTVNKKSYIVNLFDGDLHMLKPTVSWLGLPLRQLGFLYADVAISVRGLHQKKL